MNVFTPDEAKKKRGTLAEEMLCCPKCGEHQGVHIYTPPRVESPILKSQTPEQDSIPILLRAPYHTKQPQVPIPKAVDSIHVELWNCLSCRHRWWEKFQIKSPSSGVVGNLFDRIMNVEGE